MSSKFTIVGCGGWGTALALVLCERGHEVSMLGHDGDHVEKMKKDRANARYLPGIDIPTDIEITADADEALEGATTVINAVPAQWSRTFFTEIRDAMPRRAAILSVSKGIEVGSLERPSQILKGLFPKHPIAVLSGPSHAEEVARHSPSSVVIAAGSHAFARKLQTAMTTPRFRVYTNTDPTGVELAGALKNVIAIAAGICDGLGFGDNTKAALVTRGLVEITRLARKLGARQRTFAGLAGMGDLITSAFSRHGRNRAVGEKLGRGVPLQKIIADTPMVAEGVPTTRSALALARKLRVDMPIVREVHDILFEEKKPLDALTSLMTRSAKTEI